MASRRRTESSILSISSLAFGTLLERLMASDPLFSSAIRRILYSRIGTAPLSNCVNSSGECFRSQSAGSSGNRSNRRSSCNLAAVTASSSVQTTLSVRSEEHTSELQSRQYLVCRLLLEKKKQIYTDTSASLMSTIVQ